MDKKSSDYIRDKQQIPSRNEIINLLNKVRGPLKFSQITKRLGVKNNNKDKLEGLSRRLHAMTRDGQILQNRHGDYGVSAKMDLVIGTVQGNSDGFGFLLREDGGKDLFLHFKQMRKVMHGDRALAQVVEYRGKAEAKIVEVLERGNKTLVVKFLLEQGVGLGIPVNTRIKHEIIIPENMQNGASHSQMVLVELVQYPDSRYHAIGKVVEILGGYLDPGMETDVALRAWGVPHAWSNEVVDAASKIPTVVEAHDFVDRVDLTKVPFVTVDGEDSRDFDDAVWCEPAKNGWKALVAIADVAHYVSTGSILDEAAKVRGNSVYFPGTVVPMLPESLSNGICSLNPEVKRCALICEIFVNKNGAVYKSKFYQAIICSHARLTYTEVGAEFDILSTKKIGKLIKYLPMLSDLYNLYQAMQKNRDKLGAINFDTVETKIKFNKNQKIEALLSTHRNDAHKMIEELMIAANICAGKFLTRHKIPGLYRVHGGPKESKLLELRDFLSEFGIVFKGGKKPKPMDFANVLKQAETKPEYELIQTVLLRSLTQAVYSPRNDGHFGLALDVYAHFTSPIRRYPDLLVHRAIKHILATGSSKKYAYAYEDMANLGIHCSVTERRADDATRDVIDWLKCEYMRDKIGQHFSGRVSGVTSFGLFVRLDKIHVDGLVHISFLDSDYYHFDAVRHRLVGESSGRIYSIDDRLRIVVSRVDLDERKIDFALEKGEKSGRKKPRRKTRKHSET